MSEIAVHSNKALPYVAQQADVPTSEPIFVLTSTQLQEIISKVVQDAREPLLARIKALEDRTIQQDQDRAKFNALEKDMDSLAENQFNQLRLINELRQKPENDSPLLDELYKEMKAIDRKQTDFATAARMVKRSKRRMIQLKAAIALDQRFVLIPSESHSQKILIRLKEFYKTA